MSTSTVAGEVTIVFRSWYAMPIGIMGCQQLVGRASGCLSHALLSGHQLGCLADLISFSAMDMPSRRGRHMMALTKTHPRGSLAPIWESGVVDASPCRKAGANLDVQPIAWDAHTQSGVRKRQARTSARGEEAPFMANGTMIKTKRGPALTAVGLEQWKSAWADPPQIILVCGFSCTSEDARTAQRSHATSCTEM